MNCVGPCEAKGRARQYKVSVDFVLRHVHSTHPVVAQVASETNGKRFCPESFTKLSCLYHTCRCTGACTADFSRLLPSYVGSGCVMHERNAGDRKQAYFSGVWNFRLRGADSNVISVERVEPGVLRHLPNHCRSAAAA